MRSIGLRRRAAHGPRDPNVSRTFWAYISTRRIRSRRFEARRLAPQLRYTLAGAVRSSSLDYASRGDQAGYLWHCAPVELSNVPPALAIMLIAFAYLEEDGV
jgi:hypothetical protein